MCWWDELGRGAPPRSNTTFDHQYTKALSRWRLPSFESLSVAPKMVPCHQPALEQSRAWQRGAKGASNFSAEHVTPSIPQKPVYALKVSEQTAAIYLDGNSFELLTQMVKTGWLKKGQQRHWSLIKNQWSCSAICVFFKELKPHWIEQVRQGSLLKSFSQIHW